MAKLAKKKKNPHKEAAIQLFAFNHGITLQEVANKIGVSHKVVKNWREDPEFHLAIYNSYMNEFDSKLPSILDAMVREAQEGNVQAGRLILEHSGKLVKNVVNVTISPYEMFLNKVDEGADDGELIEAATDVDFEEIDLPPRNPENQRLRTIKESKKVKEVVCKEEYNAKQREWYRWRKRAEKVGVSPLKNRRPTPAQRKEWQNKIIQAESSKTS
tara:strand:+ start:687 stop:1331 length:645 start_codon:yes stop_codon:yes gene_type:complete